MDVGRRLSPVSEPPWVLVVIIHACYLWRSMREKLLCTLRKFGILVKDCCWAARGTAARC